MESHRPGLLIVDDEWQTIKYAEALLADRCVVFKARSAEEALSVIAGNTEAIHIVITDERMPAVSGLDLLKTIRDRYPGVIRILTSAYLNERSLTDAMATQLVNQFLPKPWEFEMIGELLDNAGAWANRPELPDESPTVREDPATSDPAPAALAQFLQDSLTPVLYLIDHLQANPIPDLVEPDLLADLQAHVSEVTRILGWAARLHPTVAVRSPKSLSVKSAVADTVTRLGLFADQHLAEISLSVDESATATAEEWELSALCRFALLTLIFSHPGGSKIEIAVPATDKSPTTIEFRADSTTPNAPGPGSHLASHFHSLLARLATRMGASVQIHHSPQQTCLHVSLIEGRKV